MHAVSVCAFGVRRLPQRSSAHDTPASLCSSRCCRQHIRNRRSLPDRGSFFEQCLDGAPARYK
eukprot:12929451-Prorocentrum_lima.AAC.1